ncbi:hypothetical protein SKAU_G00242270 [Synaphobranchus kaupii]|uniref:Uncharacterized protein n=1 Tax=Synaphobranchus kaupii TaxID=118154 RepID=A0A9Q1IUG7_SYNKA|nr:hypothetical protein SKAU_G00242270 [Synaphobranchus kaupii]
MILVLPLVFSLVDAFQVTQPEKRAVNHDGSVTIACRLWNADPDWTMEAKLKFPNKSVACNGVPGVLQDCFWRTDGRNCVLFTFFNPEPRDDELYVCEFCRTSPVPARSVRGKGTQLISETTLRCSETQCPDPSALNWLLIGLVIFFSCTSLTATVAYLHLRKLKSKELSGSLTYMPMQRKTGDPESNSEYMKMGRVRSGARSSERGNGRKAGEVYG